MIEQLKKYRNKETIVLLPTYDLELKDSLLETFKNIIRIDRVSENPEIIDVINKSKIKKIYLVGNNDIYRFILPRIKKDIDVCWIYKNSFSALSNGDVRYTLHCIFEFLDRSLVKTIGCLEDNNYRVLTNAGYQCEMIKLKSKKYEKKYEESNTIGILSNDHDPNNNFYNELAALTFIDYDYCKSMAVMGESYHFCEYFNIKHKVYNRICDAMSNNFVNLYINFTNTNMELIKMSFDFNVPCIVGNTDFFNKSKYLKEHLVVKSDDDINEIVEKVEFVRKNRDKIMEEYSKL